MNKSRSFKIVAAALSMAVVLSACGGNGGNTGQPAPSGSPDAAAGGNAPAKPGQVKELSLFIDASWYPVTEWKGPVADMITEKTGVKLKVTVATDDKQLPLMIASGDLPDLVFTSSNIDRLSDSKLSYSWNEPD